MFNLETKLEQLIQPVASCDYRTPLSIWISKILASSQDIMVIVDEKQIPKGLVTKIDMLSFISESSPLKQDKDVNWDCQTSIKDLIKPLTCLPTTTTVKQFLDCLNSKLENNNYAVIDCQGKLLGLVNISQILENLNHVASKPTNKSAHPFSQVIANLLVKNNWQPLQSNQNNDLVNQELRSKTEDYGDANHDIYTNNHEISSFLCSLLNGIALPLQIKNINGEIFYTNPAWNQEIDSQSPYSKSSENTASKSRLTLNEKYLNHPKTINPLESKIAQHQCSQLNNFLLSPFSSKVIPLAKSHFSNWSELSLDKSTQDSIEPKQTNDLRNRKWKYYKLPFSIQQDSLALGDKPKYFLVIATKVDSPNNFNHLHFSQIQNNLQQLQHQFFVSISHDLKSPLTSIIGLSNLLSEEKLGKLNDNQMRYSQMIYHSGKKLITLVNEFLNINRLTNQKLAIKAEKIALEELIYNTYQQISDKLQAIAEPGKNQSQYESCLELSVSEEAQTILADRICLHQILTRLLENSFPSFPRSQCIKITAQYWSKKWLAISIWGQGTIASSTQQAFFTQKLQSDRNNFLTSEENKQFLGLCLAQQLAKFHGGDISLIAQHNHSHQFTVLLPQVNSAHNQEKNLDRSENNNTEKAHENNWVLVFDSDLERILQWQGDFEKLGYHLLVARSDEDLIHKANCFQPNKIIIDSSCVTTETDELLQNLRSNPSTQDIGLIYRERKSEKLQPLDHNFLNNIKPRFERIITSPIDLVTLKQIFPVVKQKTSAPKQSLTVMRLSVSEDNHHLDNCILDSVFENPSFSLCHHIIEADSLEQAYLLARIWKIDAIIWDGQMLEHPETKLKSLAKITPLADIPIITLDKKNTAIANQISSLAVFPCLLPAHERSIEKLTQVIQIAAGLN